MQLPRLFPTRMTAFGLKERGDVLTAQHPTGLFLVINFYLRPFANHSLFNSLLGRTGIPRDLAGITLFLSSPASAHVTGAHIVLDGGWSLENLQTAPKTKM